MSLPINQVIIGDSGEVMAEWPVNSVDCVVTDPPYRIGFMGKDWDRALPPRRVFRQIFRVLKPGALAFVMSSPRQDVLWRMLSILDGVGFNLRTSFIVWVYRTGFPKAYDVSAGIDRKLGLKREVVAPYPAMTGQKYKWGKKGIYGEGNNPQEMVITEPASDLAKQWEGWKSQTGLKPAAECILMVNKPRSEKTIVDNVLRWGTGAMNVDACRIPFSKMGEDPRLGGKGDWSIEKTAENVYGEYKGEGRISTSDKGRFPANLIISNGALDTGETTKTGNITPEQNFKKTDEGYVPANVYGKYRRIPYTHEDDEGSPYRFFDLDAWAEHKGFLDVAKPTKAERDFGLWGFDEEEMGSLQGSNDGSLIGTRGRRREGKPTLRRNIHPTCKPVKLMAYLIELGCPPKGIVVDPFLGSGTTCIAAKKLRRQWIGIEINPEYAAIAQARIDIRGPLDQYMEAKK